MSNSVRSNGGAARCWRHAEASSLYTRAGGRKYINHHERLRALATMDELREDQRLFALTLAWSGARPSEALALTAASFQLESAVVAIRTLKRRRFSVREVPLPPDLMQALDRHFGFARRQADPDLAARRLWPWCRQTCWRFVKKTMREAAIGGAQACPRGLRHGFGVGTLQSGVPLNLTQRWLGHARIATTAIYADACGPEEQALAARFWRTSLTTAGASPAPDLDRAA